MTEFTGEGLYITPQDLSSVSPDGDDDDRMFHHDGSSSISITGGGSDSERGFYIWDADANAWYPLFRKADKLDGKDAGDFLWRDGSLAMEADLDAGNYGLINVGNVTGGTGEINLNSNHVEIQSNNAGSNLRLLDANSLLIADAIEGGNFDIPNGELSEQGARVATRTWTNANADVPNADYADNANNLDGYDESAFLHVSGDQMEGVLDLGSNNIEDGTDVLWDAVNAQVPQVSLGGPASSLSSYPLASGDLSEDYALTSRFPLPASDLAEDYALTSRFPLPASDLAEDYALTSRFPIPNSDLSNSSVTISAGNQLSGGGSVSLGGSVTVSVDEGSGSGLDADTLDGSHKSDLDSQYVDASGDTLSGVLDVSSNDVVDGTTTVWDTSIGAVPQAVLGGPASSLGGYPLLNSDLANSTVTVTAGNQLSGGGSVGLGGSITVDVNEGSGSGLDADTVDGDQASDLVHVAGDTMTGSLDVQGVFASGVSDKAGTFGSTDHTNNYIQLRNSQYGSKIGYADGTNGTVVQSGNAGKNISLQVDSDVFDGGVEVLRADGDNYEVTIPNGALYNQGNRVATRAWTDSNADVPNADYADSAGDSDTLDGEHASAFADAGHLHDSRYILEGGDTMTGTLTLTDGSTAASQSWVNGNADVPNADYADSAGDANTLDSLDSSQFLRSDTSDTLNATLSVSGETKVQFGGSNFHVRYDSGRDVLILGSAENGEIMEVDNAGNLRIEGSLTEGATIGA